MQSVDTCLVAIGTRSTGYGHITRSIEIFDLLRRSTNSVCLILTDEDGIQLVPDIQGLYPLTSEQELLQSLNGLRSSIIICDFLQASAAVFSGIKNTSCRIASVSPISTVNEIADIVITRVPVSTPVTGINLHGSRFVIAHSHKKEDNPQRLTIGVNFGGSDPEDQLSKFVQEISRTKHFLDLTIMLGPGYRGKFSSIFDCLIENPNIDFSAHQSTCRFWELLAYRDILIVSGGLALYEAIHRKVPAIAFLPEREKTALIPEDLVGRGVPWIAHTIDECLGKLRAIYEDREILEAQKKELLKIDFSSNTKNVVEALVNFIR
jgi:spore coat polysaccharide biosynthesis predicted glycosyltransferase SpsG